MELSNEFRVGVPVADAWKVLTDVERIAPLLPGAQLQEVEGEEYRGIVKVKVGPITAQYKGKATFVERDEEAGRVVLRASGRDTRGQGNATADITATMSPDGDGTKVTVVTDLTVTGKVAQFGRGVMAEVSAKLMGQFVDALEEDLAQSGSGSPEGNGSTPAPTVAGNGSAEATDTTAPPVLRSVDSQEAEPVDLLAVAGGSVMRRVVPIAGVALVVVVVLIRRRAHQEAQRLSRLRAFALRQG
jgi:carbon monoxide dehydrogenase subunit G